MDEFIKSTLFLVMLLNPFLVILYLTDVVQKLEPKKFRQVLFKGGLIALFIFCLFSFLGDYLFSKVLQVQFASFQIFGGILFLLIGIQFFLKGPNAMELLRGDSEQIATSIAMPVLIGPGTISASILAGKKLDTGLAFLSIFIAVFTCLITIVLLKAVHDYVQTRNAKLIEKYIEMTGRVTALYVGTVAVEMIMIGLRSWINLF